MNHENFFGTVKFLLYVLGDHARFIFQTLNQEIEQAKHFIKIFDQLLRQSRTSLSLQQLNNLTSQATTTQKKFVRLNLKF